MRSTGGIGIDGSMDGLKDSLVDGRFKGRKCHTNKERERAMMLHQYYFEIY